MEPSQRPSLLIVSSSYPDEKMIYGDVFVHTRARAYARYFNVSVIGYKAGVTQPVDYAFEDIPVRKTGDLADFSESIRKLDPDVILVHFIEHPYMDILQTCGKPLVLFVHGYEALSWKRRLMNYNSPTALPYLLQYWRENSTQLRALKNFLSQTRNRRDVWMVFVSQWLKNAVEDDLGFSYPNSTVIPNGIDTEIFAFSEKPPELRKKILLIRSFKARNYANDISIDAILRLSERPFFGELEFAIYGEGFLFPRLTGKVKHLPNVKLHNYFVLNRDIPAIHQSYGVFLCPSRLDTQGVSMCEAMASGLVPVTCPVGGIPEYATARQSAYLVGSVREVADSIEELFYNPEKYTLMSRSSRQEILRKCDLRDTGNREMKLFISLLPTSS